VEPPSASPLAGYLAGIAWDSLPPASAVSDLPPDTGALPVLQARLARRGASRPIAVLSDQRGSRRATVAATGLWRWGFRGGASDVAYRTLIGAITGWLLGGGGGRIVLGRMAAGGGRTGRAAGPRGCATRVAGVARALVAVRARHRCILRGMGVAPPAGPALTPRGAMTLELTTSVKYLKGVGPK